MRVAFITDEFPPQVEGGAGVVAYHLAKRLRELNHEPIVITPGRCNRGECDYDLSSIKIVNVKISKWLPFPSFQFWIKLPMVVRNLEKEEKFDIIHFNGLSYCFLPKRLTLAPQVLTIHHLVTDTIKANKLNIISRIKNIALESSIIMPFIEKGGIYCADKIIAVSESTKNRIIQKYQIDNKKISVIHNGIDIINGAYNKNMVLKEEIVSNNLPKILFVGRVDDPRKNLITLVESFSLVLQSLDATLWIVGKGDAAKAKELLSSLGISSKAVFFGSVDNHKLQLLYKLCDIYVSPSKLEGFGLSILEAMAARKPVITSRVGVLTELFSDEEELFIDPDNIDQLADAIIRYIKDDSFRTMMGNRNFEIIKDKFNWAKTAKETERVYKELLDGANTEGKKHS
jgi:glycosyltransferase involved in cell wall biosynthesis